MRKKQTKHIIGPDDMQKIYQKLYTETTYGQAAVNRCPGVRNFPHYEDFLLPPIIDLGCGNGDTVRHLREHGFFSDGVDWINLTNDMMVRDITEPLDLRGYNTALCIDVLEHIPCVLVENVIENLKKVRRQVVAIHTGAASGGPKHIQLHVTQLSFKEWDIIFDVHFNIIRTVILEPTVRKLYLMEAKK